MKPGSLKAIRFLLLAGCLAAGCTSLQPVSLPGEYTSAPADSGLWDELAEARDGDWFVALNDGPTALDWRLRAIDSAADSIDLQTFLWTFDTTGSMVLDHLYQAAERGVAVKLLVDDTFLLGEDQILLEIAEHPNIEYRVYNPYKRRSDGFGTRQALNLAEFDRLDHRMHNKSMVIDNRVAFVGGRNLADEYFGIHSEANFRDIELIVGGPFVSEISNAFDRYWNDQWSFPIGMLSHINASAADLEAARQVRDRSLHIHEEETAEARDRRWRELVAGAHGGKARLFVDEPPAANPADPESAPVQVADALVDIFDTASADIVIVSAYLIPTPSLEGAVDRAIERGVRVRMLTNSIRSNNHLSAHSAYRKHIKTLITAGAELHEVRIDARDRDIYMLAPISEKQLMLHSKALVIDTDKAFVGSANLDPRSLRINTEMGILIESEALNSELRNAFSRDLELANSWRLQLDERGDVYWTSENQVLTTQPAASLMQRIEDWFFAHLPIEDEL